MGVIQRTSTWEQKAPAPLFNMWGKKNHENCEAIKEKAKEKKVTWNKNLLEIKNISPRVKKESFDFPSRNFTWDLHFEKSIPANQLNCSPQLKRVGFRSFQSKDNHRMMRRKDLTLQFDGNAEDSNSFLDSYSP